MAGSESFSEAGSISELAIVDTFTKLIFGEEADFSFGELMIIEAFRRADGNVATNNHAEMGRYLRALGVGEMIQLVTHVRRQLTTGLPVAALEPGAASRKRQLKN